MTQYSVRGAKNEENIKSCHPGPLSLSSRITLSVIPDYFFVIPPPLFVIPDLIRDPSPPSLITIINRPRIKSRVTVYSKTSKKDTA
jgi:hypothetical protein